MAIAIRESLIFNYLVVCYLQLAWSCQSAGGEENERQHFQTVGYLQVEKSNGRAKGLSMKSAIVIGKVKFLAIKSLSSLQKRRNP